jgi:hypothetical protein
MFLPIFVGGVVFEKLHEVQFELHGTLTQMKAKEL